jgi:predicted RNA-binding Zn ribbon-like protein
MTLTKVSKKTSKFLWLGNTPFLDFVNTEMVQEGQPVDLLLDARDLFEWFNRAGFRVETAAKVNNAQSAKELLNAARAYRRALRSALQIITTEGTIPSEIVHKTNHFLLRRNRWCELGKASHGVVLCDHWTIEHPEDICSPIALSFAQFLSSADLSRVRKCKNPDCVLYFYDTSKSGTRAWCSLDICGNKLRVAAFRKRSEH